MSKISALEAVALAEKKYQDTYSEVVVDAKFSTDAEDQANADAYNDLFDKLKALDACPQAEPVEGRPERPTMINGDAGLKWVLLDEYEKLEAFCDQLQSLTPAPAWLPISHKEEWRFDVGFYLIALDSGYWDVIYASVDDNGDFVDPASRDDLGWHISDADYFCSTPALPPSPHTGLEKT